MKTTRSPKPAARSSRTVAAKATAKRATAKKVAPKTGSGVVVRKRASMGGTVRASVSARAELASLLDRIHRNIDETEALLAD
jgi:carbamoylphosphate synthase large subunit